MTDKHEKSIYTHTQLWKTNKKDLIILFRKIETSLLEGSLAGNVVEDLEEDIAVFEAEEFKMKNTINELNETNEKLLKRIKFLEGCNENQKKKHNKVEAFYSEPQQKEIDKLNEDIDKIILEKGKLKSQNELISQELETVRDKDMTWILCRQLADHRVKEISDEFSKWRCDSANRINKINEDMEIVKKDNAQRLDDVAEMVDECKNKNIWNEELEDRLEKSRELFNKFAGDYTCIINNLK